MMNFTEIAKVMNNLYTKNGKLPSFIKVNPDWLEKQIQGTFVLRNGDENPIEKLLGLPMRKDDSIDTYEFVYRDEEK